MKQKIITLFFIGIYVFCFAGCKSDKKVFYDKQEGTIKYNKIEYVSFENTNGFLCCNTDGLKVIDSCWYVPLLAKTQFYSDTIESPVFICSSRTPTLWFKKDFKVLDEEFIISDTDSSINFSNIFIANNNIYLEDKYKTNNFNCFLKNHENIYINISLFENNNKHYIQFVWNKPCYEVTRQFYELLLKNKLL